MDQKWIYTQKKITGTVSACLGLIQINNIYIPNSVIKEDVRTIIPKPPGKIFAIFKKKISSNYYDAITFKSQSIEITEKCIPEELRIQIKSALLCK